MSQTFEDNPLYRFFNVLLFLAYSAVVVIAVIIGILTYSAREITSATVQCKDGTSWNALEPKNILYDSQAKCGLCTKRNPDNGSYQNCSYNETDYSSYKVTEKREAFNWSIIIYPLIAFAVGFGLVDIFRIIVMYIFSGRVALEKSMLLRTIALFVSDDNNQKTESFEETYKLLFEIEDKDKILDFVKLSTQAENSIKELDDKLNELYKREGKNEEFFEKGDITATLNPEVLEEYFKLIDEKHELQVYFEYVSHYLAALEEANKDLVNGIPTKTVKNELSKRLKKIASELTKAKVNLIASKNIGQALVQAKRKNKPNVQMKGVLKRIEEEVKNDPLSNSKESKKKE